MHGPVGFRNDFGDYSVAACDSTGVSWDDEASRLLEEERYLDDMGRLWRLFLRTCHHHLGVIHVVVFPFGMGAFLRVPDTGPS